MASARRHAFGPRIAALCWLAGCGTTGSHELGSNGALASPADDGAAAGALPPDDAAASSFAPTGVTDASADAGAAANAFTGPLLAAPAGDGASSPLWIADAAPVRASDCKAGTYSGTFVMMVSFVGVSTLTLMGNISITLVANTPSAQFGEFNSGILTVAPGAMFSAKDNLGDQLFADVSGQLDCGTLMFVGTLSNGGFYVFGNDAATGTLDGTMAATYDPGDGAVPALANGTFTFTSPQVPLTMGMGTWTATLQ